MNQKERDRVNKGLKEIFHSEDNFEPNFETAEEAMIYYREMGADLWCALDFLGVRLDKVEGPRGIEHGSCQNIYERQVAQLVYYYNVKPDAFYRWDT